MKESDFLVVVVVLFFLTIWTHYMFYSQYACHTGRSFMEHLPQSSFPVEIMICFCEDGCLDSGLMVYKLADS